MVFCPYFVPLALSENAARHVCDFIRTDHTYSLDAKFLIYPKLSKNLDVIADISSGWML
jgi:hypothetical protein